MLPVIYVVIFSPTFNCVHYPSIISFQDHLNYLQNHNLPYQIIQAEWRKYWSENCAIID